MDVPTGSKYSSKLIADRVKRWAISHVREKSKH